MRCEKIKKKIWKIFDQESRTRDREIVREHIKGCGNCRKLYKEVKGMLENLRDFPDYKTPPEFTDRLKNRIIQTYGYPKKSAKTKEGIKTMFKYGIPAAVAAVIIFLVFFSRPDLDTRAIRYYSPGQKLNLTEYSRSSGLLSRKTGYMRISLDSAVRLEGVTVDIDLPPGVRLASDEDKAVWTGNLKEGKNLLLIEVRGEQEGSWDVNGVIKKNGLQKPFTRRVNII